MTKKDKIIIFNNEIHYPPPKKTYETNMFFVKYFDDTWSLDLIVMVEYGASNNRRFT